MSADPVSPESIVAAASTANDLPAALPPELAAGVRALARDLSTIPGGMNAMFDTIVEMAAASEATLLRLYGPDSYALEVLREAREAQR